MWCSSPAVLCAVPSPAGRSRLTHSPIGTSTGRKLMSMPMPLSSPISATALAEPGGRKRLLFISNGYGEDSIAAEIIRRLPAGVVAEAYPTVGDGLAYRNVCAVVGPRAQIASEGWRNVKGSVLRDLLTGTPATILPGLAFGRRV